MTDLCTNKQLKRLISQDEIQNRVQEIAKEINDKYVNSQQLTFICVLSGAFMFFSDLVKNIVHPTQLHFIKVSSYENSSTTGFIKEVLFNLPDLACQDVIIVEDIIDTGITAKYLIDKISQNFHPKSLMFVSLFDKKCTRKVDVQPDLYGFDIDNKFIVGYGLDYDGQYRNLPYIGYFE